MEFKPTQSSIELAKDLEGPVPIKLFKKEIVPTDHFTHPDIKWELEETAERMDKQIAAFHRMQADGIPVPFMKKHSESGEDLLGYVVGMEKELSEDGYSLYGMHEVVGKENIEMVERCKTTSPYIEDFTSGKNVAYGEAITHNALAPKAVIPNQKPFEEKGRGYLSCEGPFVAIAASQIIKDENISGKTENTENTPNRRTGKMIQVDDKALQTILGIDTAITAENVAEVIKTGITSERDKAGEIGKKLTDLTATNATLAAQIKDLEKGETPEVDLDTLEDAADVRSERIDLLVEKKKISPAIAASMKVKLLGEPGKRNAYALSRKVSGLPTPLVDDVIEMFNQNDVVELGEQTKSQAKALSRTVPGSEDEEKSFSEDVHSEMLEDVGAGKTE